jgi:hypothetical protein
MQSALCAMECEKCLQPLAQQEALPLQIGYAKQRKVGRTSSPKFDCPLKAKKRHLKHIGIGDKKGTRRLSGD